MENSSTFSLEFVRRLAVGARRELWHNAVPLRVSPERFANQSLVRQYRGVVTPETPDLSSIAETAREAGGGLLATVQALQALQPKWRAENERRQAWREMQWDTVARILSGELLALGFALPRQVDDAPVSIPDDVWAGKVDWEAGKVSGEGLEFVSVRIVAPEAMEGLLPPAEADKGPPRPVGRPTVKPEVYAAYEALKAAGRVDFDGPMNRLYPEIRSHLCQVFPDRAGVFRVLSDEAIRQVVSDPFRADQAAQKQ